MRSNCVSPGRGSVATVQNSHKAGQIRTFNSDTVDATNVKGRPGVKVSF